MLLIYWRHWFLYNWSLNSVNNVAMRTHVNQGSRMWIQNKTAILVNLYSLENYAGTYIKAKTKDIAFSNQQYAYTV